MVFRAIKESLSILRKDKYILMFSLTPFVIGCICYYFLGMWVFTELLPSLQKQIESYLSFDGGSSFSYILGFFVTIALFLITNWTFLLFVSLLSSPFHDIISSRVEKLITEEKPDDVVNSIKEACKKVWNTIMNEFKKICLIFAISMLAFILSFIPILAPLSILLTVTLFSISFIDYSWSRHELSTKECIRDYKKSFFSYTITGSTLFLFASIPIVNIMMLPFSVICFTILFIEKRKKI